MGWLNSAINPLAPVSEQLARRDAKRAAERKRAEAERMEAKMGRMLGERQKRFNMLDWQPALLGDSMPQYQKTPMKADQDYLASIIAGNSPTSGNPWDAKGSKEARDAAYKAQYGMSYQDQAQLDDAAAAAIKYEAKAPKKIDTSALEYEAEDVDGIERPGRGGRK